MNFFHAVLNKFKHITTLQLSKSKEIPASGVFRKYQQAVGIFVGDFKPTNLDDSSLVVSVDSTFSDDCKILDLLLRELAHRNPQIYLRIAPSFDAEWDLNVLLSEHIKELRIVNISHNATLQASGQIPHCPILTHITAEGNYVHVDQSVAMEVWKAVRRGKLPSLRQIQILNSCLCCRYNGQLKQKFL